MDEYNSPAFPSLYSPEANKTKHSKISSYHYDNYGNAEATHINDLLYDKFILSSNKKKCDSIPISPPSTEIKEQNSPEHLIDIEINPKNNRLKRRIIELNINLQYLPKTIENLKITSYKKIQSNLRPIDYKEEIIDSFSFTNSPKNRGNNIGNSNLAKDGSDISKNLLDNNNYKKIKKDKMPTLCTKIYIIPKKLIEKDSASSFISKLYSKKNYRVNILQNPINNLSLITKGKIVFDKLNLVKKIKILPPIKKYNTNRLSNLEISKINKPHDFVNYNNEMKKGNDALNKSSSNTIRSIETKVISLNELNKTLETKFTKIYPPIIKKQSEALKNLKRAFQEADKTIKKNRLIILQEQKKNNRVKFKDIKKHCGKIDDCPICRRNRERFLEIYKEGILHNYNKKLNSNNRSFQKLKLIKSNQRINSWDFKKIKNISIQQNIKTEKIKRINIYNKSLEKSHQNFN